MRTVAALYVDPRGPYPKMEGVDCWDEMRDARLYDGPHPVVAHPPCGPWGRLKGLCRNQDPSCGPLAVDAVRRWGGILEHPADSSLWKRCGLAMTSVGGDGFGFSVEVKQVAWGHVSVKRTWLYFVGVDRGLVVAGIRSGGTPVACVTGGPNSPRNHRRRATDRENKLTPPAFAEWLVSLARSVST